MKLIPTEQHSKFFRDEKSSAIINTDLEGLRSYKQQRKQNLEVRNLKKDVDSIRQDIVELKHLMKSIAVNLNRENK